MSNKYKSPYKEGGINIKRLLDTNNGGGGHMFKGFNHSGKKQNCIICSGKSPSIVGYMGGGVTGRKI